jgi:hypothetical protein
VLFQQIQHTRLTILGRESHIKPMTCPCENSLYTQDMSPNLASNLRARRFLVQHLVDTNLSGRARTELRVLDIVYHSFVLLILLEWSFMCLIVFMVVDAAESLEQPRTNG